MRFLHFVAAGGLGLATASCGLDSNGLSGDDGGAATIDDASGVLPFDGTISTGGGNDGAGQPGPDGGVADTATANVDASGNDGGTTGTDATPPPDSCGSVEICNNGIDDNCNGLIDCADPQCNSGWTCTAAAIPPGWSIVEYAMSSRPACSTGYGTPVNLVEGPSGSAAHCGCDCAVSGGSCEEGNFKVSVTGFGGGGGCNSPPIPAAAPANGGACSPSTAPYSPQPGSKMQVELAPYTPGTCSPEPSASSPPVTYAGQGLACAESAVTGAGCPSSGVCAPSPAGGGFGLCIEHDGPQSCPGGFPHLHAVGTGVTDTRGCTACSCMGPTGGGCGNAQLTLYTDSACADGGVSVNADGNCNNFNSPGGGGPGGPTYVAYEYTATVQGEKCMASSVSATGGVALTGPKTICCQ